MDACLQDVYHSQARTPGAEDPDFFQFAHLKPSGD